MRADVMGEAARLSELFHGRPVQSIREVPGVLKRRDVFTDLGRLVYVWVTNERTPAGKAFKITYDKKTRLASSPDGRSLYVRGGDQRITNLAAIVGRGAAAKDFVLVGFVRDLVYETERAANDFERKQYIHELGEESGVQPLLVLDTINNAQVIVGGEYTTKDWIYN
jgi:hypothetical protein